jgi:hypothetical protein
MEPISTDLDRGNLHAFNTALSDKTAAGTQLPNSSTLVLLELTADNRRLVTVFEPSTRAVSRFSITENGSIDLNVAGPFFRENYAPEQVLQRLRMGTPMQTQDARRILAEVFGVNEGFSSRDLLQELNLSGPVQTTLNDPSLTPKWAVMSKEEARAFCSHFTGQTLHVWNNQNRTAQVETENEWLSADICLVPGNAGELGLSAMVMALAVRGTDENTTMHYDLSRFVFEFRDARGLILIGRTQAGGSELIFSQGGPTKGASYTLTVKDLDA